ncbi:hypothetical protein DMUE_1395, partial [Dictyocoela muelleri]
FNNKFKLIPNKDLKTDYNRTILNVKKFVNITKNKNQKIKQKINNNFQLNCRSILSKRTKKANYFLYHHHTSKTYFSIEKYRTILARIDEIDSPYDFDSPNFSLDFLNSYIIHLNENYLEKCKNIFSVVSEKISEVLFRLKCYNKILEPTKCKTSLTYKCYLKINSSIETILKENLAEEIPIYIHINSFINLNRKNLDLIMNKKAEYNIFRTNENENDAINSLIKKIENKYKDEAKKTAKSAYNIS